MDSFVIPALGFISVFLVIASLPVMREGLQRWLEHASFQQSGIIPAEQEVLGYSRDRLLKITLSGAVIGAIVTGLLSSNLVFAILVFVIILFIPKWMHAYIRQARLLEFEERLPAALDQMSSSAKAGLSLAQAIEEVGKNGAMPVSDEFASIAREHQLGADLEKAILNARDRIQSKPFNLVVSALLVNLKKGGNLPEALVTLSASLKEVWRLEQKLITASAEGRKAIWVISGVPIFIALLVFALQPDLANALTSGLLGMAILTAAIFVYVLGLYWLRSILNQDI